MAGSVLFHGASGACFNGLLIRLNPINKNYIKERIISQTYLRYAAVRKMIDEKELIDLMTKTGEAYLMDKTEEGTRYAKEMIHKLDFSEKRDQEVLIQVLGHALIRHDELEVLDELHNVGFDFDMRFERGVTLTEFFSKYDKFNSDDRVYKKLAEFGAGSVKDSVSAKKIQMLFEKNENEYNPWWNCDIPFTDYSFRIASDELNSSVMELAEQLSSESAAESGEGGLSALHLLVLHNFYEAAEIVLKKGTNPNIPGGQGKGKSADVYLGVTPVHLACYMGNYKMVKLLVDNGADTALCDDLGRNCYHFLASINYDGMMGNLTGQYKTVKQRLNIVPLLSGDINAKDKQGITPLTQLLSNNNKNMQKTLIKAYIDKGADITAVDEHGNNALINAVINNSISSSMMLMMNKELINLQNSDGDTPLHIAAREENFEIAYALINMGADTGIVNNNGETAADIIEDGYNDILKKRISTKRMIPLKEQLRVIQQACFSINEENSDNLLFALECAKRLLKEIDEDDDEELSYILEIIECTLREDEECSILDVISQAGFDFNMPISRWGTMTNIRDFCMSDNLGIKAIRKLNELGVDLESVYLKGRTPANIVAAISERDIFFKEESETYCKDAVAYFNTESFELLNDEGLSAMHLAAKNNHCAMLQAMAEKGADINITADAPAEIGITPLHEACIQGNVKMIELLMKLGADDTIKNNKGETPAHMAVQKKIFHKEIKSDVRVKMLEALDAVDIPEDDGKTPLLLAQLQDYGTAVDVTNALLDREVDINHTDNNGNTALLLHADRHCNKDIIKALIRAGADINAKNKNGDTALHFALEHGNSEAARFLIKKGADYQAVNNKGKSPMEIAAEKGYEAVLELMM